MERFHVIIIMFGFIGMVRTARHSIEMGLPMVPIQIKSVDVTSSTSTCTNVTVDVITTNNVNVLWTVDDGYVPEELNALTTRLESKNPSGKSVSICLPKDLKFQSLKLHLICEIHSFELHLALQISHGMQTTHVDIQQPLFLVPSGNEIGISSRGEARFHVMVDTSASKFYFGMLQAEATIMNSENVEFYSAYSFLPDNSNKNVRIISMSDAASTEYHADVIIKSRDLPNSETLVSVATACTHLHDIIQRLDMKKVIYLNRKADVQNSVAFVGEQNQEYMQLLKSENALLRCKAFGKPRPSVALYQMNGTQASLVTIPSYITRLEQETTVVYQLFNVTESDSAEYMCKASNEKSSAQKLYNVKVMAL